MGNDPLKPVRLWRVYYSPDSWVCSGGGIEPAQLDDGIQVIVAIESEEYRRVLCGSDWYFFDGEFIGTLGDYVSEKYDQVPGEWRDPQPILDAHPGAVLKKGITIDDEAFNLTKQLALEVRWP